MSCEQIWVAAVLRTGDGLQTDFIGCAAQETRFFPCAANS
jgi:hypothetical protein